MHNFTLGYKYFLHFSGRRLFAYDIFIHTRLSRAYLALARFLIGHMMPLYSL